MNITEIRVKLVESNSERLRAFCSVTLDGSFVIRDLKIIDGTNGPFVAMPSRKICDHCPHCGTKNHLRARFCNDCGERLDAGRAPRDADGRVKYHADIAHPIHSEGREEIQRKVIAAYVEEAQRAQEPDYKPAVLDFDDAAPSEYDDFIPELKGMAARRRTAAASAPSQAAAMPFSPGAAPRRDIPEEPAPRRAPAPARPAKTPQAAEDPFSAGIL